MNKIIDVIVDLTYAKYGKTTIFREYEFKPITVNKTTAVYRVQSAVNFPYIYEIQLHVFDKVLYSPSILGLFHKCMYCNGKNSDYKMRCCNKYLHLECGVRNKFACCHVSNYLVSQEKGECCVCLEPTYSLTECGHHVCVSCLEEMYKNSNTKDNKVLCPYCRNTIIKEETEFMDYKNVTVGNKDEIVFVTMC